MNLKDAVKEAIELLKAAKSDTTKLSLTIEEGYSGYSLKKCIETEKDKVTTYTWNYNYKPGDKDA